MSKAEDQRRHLKRAIGRALFAGAGVGVILIGLYLALWERQFEGNAIVGLGALVVLGGIYLFLIGLRYSGYKERESPTVGQP